MPETVSDQGGLEVAGRVGDAQIHEPFADSSRKANLSESWHCVQWVGRAEGCYLPAREGLQVPHDRPGRSLTLSGAKISTVASKQPALQEQKYAEVKSSSLA